MIYPQSHPITGDVVPVLQQISANAAACTSIFLDTTIDEKKHQTHQEDHHQGLGRTHRLRDGSVYFFLSHSVIGGKGKIMQFKFSGPLNGEHVLTTNPLSVAQMTERLELPEEHPSDICFLPDIDHSDAGYLFVTQEFQMKRIAVYAWQPKKNLLCLGYISHDFQNIGEKSGPNFLFVDRVDQYYWLGYASDHNEACALFRAKVEELFPTDKIGTMDITAFKAYVPHVTFSFPVTAGPSQVKLIRNDKGTWWLLAFRSDPNDKENATDYVDVYPVQFAPVFRIFDRTHTEHIYLKPGDTSFASSGTHHVESTGRLLLASSYRWAENEGPGSSSYVSRVDECPSA